MTFLLGLNATEDDAESKFIASTTAMQVHSLHARMRSLTQRKSFQGYAPMKSRATSRMIVLQAPVSSSELVASTLRISPPVGGLQTLRRKKRQLHKQRSRIATKSTETEWLTRVGMTKNLVWNCGNENQPLAKISDEVILGTKLVTNVCTNRHTRTSNNE